MTEGRTRLRFSFRFTISAVLIGLIVLLAGALMAASWHFGTRSITTLVDQILVRSGGHVVDRARSYTDPAQKAAKLSDELARSQVIQTGHFRQFEDYFLRVMAVYEQIAMLNYGNEQGDFLMTKHFPDDMEMEAHLLVPNPSGDCRAGGMWDDVEALVDQPGFCPGPLRPYVARKGTYGTKIIQRRGAHSFLLWKFRDATGRVVAVSYRRHFKYDPRVRPWYKLVKKTGRAGWTSVYIFYTDKKPGIGATAPVRDQDGNMVGVVDAEIELYGLSEFLATLKIGKSGKVFVVDGKGRLVGYPDSKQLRKKEGKGSDKWVLSRPQDVSDGAVGASYAKLAAMGRLPLDGPVRFSFTYHGKAYRAMYRPFPGGVGQDWVVGIVVAEDEFLDRIRVNRHAMLLLSLLLAFFAVFVSMVVARAISKPLWVLSTEAERIGRLELTGGLAVSSRLAEVDELAHAMERMKKGLKSFGKYVPRKVVQSLVTAGQEARLEGERRTCTVFFSDVVGFTSIAEGMDPESLVEHLSEYLEVVTSTLMENGATIDKYIGDAVMAFWGAPEPLEDHASKACLAALAVQRRLAEANEKWEKAGLPVLHTRMGIHTGELIVGNVGSTERMNYTVIGDTVNLASRLEGINKVYGTHLALSAEVLAAAGDGFAVRVLDVVAVKGRREGVRIYELRGLSEEIDDQERRFEELCEQALDAYLARDFEQAMSSWQQASDLVGGDRACQVMMDRCREFVRQPPPQDWNGVYVARSK